MAHRSKLAIQANDNKHRSRLAKAVQSLNNLEDFSTKPSGVWGSVATIKTNSVTIKSTELDFEFEIPFDDNLEANEGEIIVYNLSDNTINQLSSKFKRDKKITVEAGYDDDTGVIFDGYIASVKTVREDADRVTTIKIKDDIEDKNALNISFSSGVTAGQILNYLINQTGYKEGKINIPHDRASYTYENDVKLDEPLEECIRTFSEVCGVSTFKSKGKIYCCNLNDFKTVEFTVSSDTGMIGSPMPFTEEISAEKYTDTVNGYEIDMLLQHRMAAGSVISLKSNDYNGKYVVKSGTHTFNSTECITKIKVISSYDTKKADDEEAETAYTNVSLD